MLSEGQIENLGGLEQMPIAASCCFLDTTFGPQIGTQRRRYLVKMTETSRVKDSGKAPV